MNNRKQIYRTSGRYPSNRYGASIDIESTYICELLWRSMRKQRWTCMEVALHYWDTFLKRKHRIANDAFGVVGLRAMESPVSRSPLPSFSSLSPLLLVGVYRTAIEHLSGIYPRENLPKQVSKHNGEYLGELYSSLLLLLHSIEIR